MKIGQVTFWKIDGDTDINYIDGNYNVINTPKVSKFYKEVLS